MADKNEQDRLKKQYLKEGYFKEQGNTKALLDMQIGKKAARQCEASAKKTQELNKLTDEDAARLELYLKLYMLDNPDAKKNAEKGKFGMPLEQTGFTPSAESKYYSSQFNAALEGARAELGANAPEADVRTLAENHYKTWRNDPQNVYSEDNYRQAFDLPADAPIPQSEDLRNMPSTVSLKGGSLAGPQFYEAQPAAAQDKGNGPLGNGGMLGGGRNRPSVQAQAAKERAAAQQPAAQPQAQTQPAGALGSQQNPYPNSIVTQSKAKEGDWIQTKNGPYKLTQGDIDWAKRYVEGKKQPQAQQKQQQQQQQQQQPQQPQAKQQESTKSEDDFLKQFYSSYKNTLYRKIYEQCYDKRVDVRDVVRAMANCVSVEELRTLQTAYGLDDISGRFKTDAGLLNAIKDTNIRMGRNPAPFIVPDNAPNKQAVSNDNTTPPPAGSGSDAPAENNTPEIPIQDSLTKPLGEPYNKDVEYIARMLQEGKLKYKPSDVDEGTWESANKRLQAYNDSVANLSAKDSAQGGSTAKGNSDSNAKNDATAIGNMPFNPADIANRTNSNYTGEKSSSKISKNEYNEQVNTAIAIIKNSNGAKPIKPSYMSQEAWNEALQKCVDEANAEREAAMAKSNAPIDEANKHVKEAKQNGIVPSVVWRQ